MYRSSDRLYFNLNTELVKYIDVAMASFSSITFRRANVSMYRSPAPSPTGSALRWSNLTHPLRHRIPTNRRATHISTNGRAPRVRFSRKSTNQKALPQAFFPIAEHLFATYLLVLCLSQHGFRFSSLHQSAAARHGITYRSVHNNDCICMFPVFPYEKQYYILD